MRSLLIALVVMLAACGAPIAPDPGTPASPPSAPEPATPASPPSAPEPASPEAAQPIPEPNMSTLPTPFTADQILDAMPVGTEVRLTIAAAGKPTIQSDWTVTKSDADGVTIAYRTLTEDGTTDVEPPSEGSYGWEELRQHALYKAADTTRLDGQTLDTPLGTLTTIRYVRSTRGESEKVETYDFAVDIPGPPVLVRTTVDGQQVLSMAMTRRTGFPKQ